MNPIVTITHDAFARFETVRRVSDIPAQSCKWCGGKRAHSTYLFEYGFHQDDRGQLEPDWCKGLFCSISCFRTFNCIFT